LKVSLLREGATQLPCRVVPVLGNHLCGLPLRPQIFRLHFLPIARSFKPPPVDAKDQTDIVRIPFRPPDVTVASWVSSIVVYELATTGLLRTSLPKLRISAMLGLPPTAVYGVTHACRHRQRLLTCQKRVHTAPLPK